MRVKTGYPPTFPVRYVLNGQHRQTEIPLPKDPDYWRSWQRRKMLLDPDMVLQFVRFTAKSMRDQGAEQVDIRAIVPVSLNGRPPQLLIDTKTNLANIERSLWHKPWITAFDETIDEGDIQKTDDGRSFDGGEAE